jgi:hypothetical protein
MTVCGTCGPLGAPPSGLSNPCRPTRTPRGAPKFVRSKFQPLRPRTLPRKGLRSGWLPEYDRSMTAGLIYDYDAIWRALECMESCKLELEVRHLNGPDWNPPHLRPQAARLYQYVRQPFAWCENPIRFGWGEPGPTWWCTSILVHRRNWDFPVVDGRSLGPVELPSTWCLYRDTRRPLVKIPEEFDSFDDALAALAAQ